MICSLAFIGGFALAARWMNWQTVGFCEIEPYPQAVLAKNFPGVPIFQDVSTLDATELAGLGQIDIVTGGFPCQDVSTAGKRAGLAGARSGLWAEMFRIIQSARPAWVVAENVPGLRTIGADRVLADLAEAGYTAWPVVVGAVHAGAPHRRQRVWIVAHSADSVQRGCNDRGTIGAVGETQRQESERGHQPSTAATHSLAADDTSDTEDMQRNGRRIHARIRVEGRSLPESRDSDQQDDAADATVLLAGREQVDAGPDAAGHRGAPGAGEARGTGEGAAQGTAADAAQFGRREGRPESARIEGRHGAADGGAGVYQPDWRGWTDAPQPAICRLDDGLPTGLAGCRVPALKALGNAIVPQIALEIFRAIEASQRG